MPIAMSDEKQPEAPKARSPSAGRLLATARTELQLTLKDVGERLNLGVYIIEALEQDAYERLPNATFARGYLRSYAKLLKLDEEKIVSSANFETAVQVGEALTVKTTMKPQKPFKPRREFHTRMRRKKHSGLVFRILLIVGILVGLIWVAFDQVPEQLANIDMTKLAETLKLPTDFFK